MRIIAAIDGIWLHTQNPSSVYLQNLHFNFYCGSTGALSSIAVTPIGSICYANVGHVESSDYTLALPAIARLQDTSMTTPGRVFVADDAYASNATQYCMLTQNGYKCSPHIVWTRLMRKQLRQYMRRPRLCAEYVMRSLQVTYKRMRCGMPSDMDRTRFWMGAWYVGKGEREGRGGGGGGGGEMRTQ